ncbi:hypothetical protein [Streptomyces sp. XH2]|uniref:hypothetical protein n=1 Tax=Streptomyces sp. XH2 TaxID=3412483 RepID=UPI003C79F68D
MLSTVVAVLLGLWLAVTVLAALPRIGGAVRSRVPAWFSPLVPSWTFFAPRPATRDQILMYRDFLAGGAACPLREVWPGGGPRGRAGKAASDAIGHLLEAVAESRRAGRGHGPEEARLRDARLMVGTPYLLLLGRAAAAPHDATAVGYQFAIAAASLREESPEVIFVSAVHRLESGVPGGVPC